MHIGLAGPIDLAPLRDYLGDDDLPETYCGPSTGLLARTWLDQDHQVTVYALSEKVTERQVRDAGPLRVVIVPQRPQARCRARDFFRREREVLVSAMRAHPADVISAHWTYEFALAAIASDLPACVTARDAPLRCAWEMRSAYRWLRHTMAVPAVHRATALSANSPYTARHLRRCLAARRPIETIPNGVRVTDLPTAEAAAPGQAPVFACAAQGWCRLKNTTAVLEALPLVRSVLPGARLLLFGDGHGPDGPAQHWAARHGLLAGVTFVGRVGHAALLRHMASEAHALVHPSLVESFSMVCAEAMGMGVPVVAGRRSGAVPWVVGDAGVLTDVTDPLALAAAMVGAVRHEDRRMQLVAAGRARVRKHFALDDTASAYVRWFSQVIKTC